jgi:DNA-binding Lrp family transcriptional regulator
LFANGFDAMDRESTAGKILEFLLENEGRDILQSDLWKELGLSSKDVSKILKKLEEEGLIKREPVVYKGRKTYKIMVLSDSLLNSDKIGVTRSVGRYLMRKLVNEALDIPCLSCPYISKCYEGGFYDPVNCQFLNEWILRNMRDRKQGASLPAQL